MTDKFKNQDNDCTEIVKDYPELEKIVKRVEAKINNEWIGFINYVVGIFILGTSLGLVNKVYSHDFKYEDTVLVFFLTFILSMLLVHESQKFPEEIKIVRSINNYNVLNEIFNKIFSLFIENYPKSSYIEKEDLALINAITCLDKTLIKNIDSLLKTKLFFLSSVSFLILISISYFNIKVPYEEYIINIVNISDEVIYYSFHIISLIIVYLILLLPFFIKILYRISKAFIFIYSVMFIIIFWQLIFFIFILLVLVIPFISLFLILIHKHLTYHIRKKLELNLGKLQKIKQKNP